MLKEDYTDLKRTIETLRQSERRFRDQALRDSLTGLYNQRYLYQSLAGCIERAQTTDTPISLIFLNLDHFKQVVDTYGHLNGSRAIREVGRTIDNCLKEPAYAVAYAGDEFVVVLPGMNAHQALNKPGQNPKSEEDQHEENRLERHPPHRLVRSVRSYRRGTQDGQRDEEDHGR